MTQNETQKFDDSINQVELDSIIETMQKLNCFRGVGSDLLAPIAQATAVLEYEAGETIIAIGQWDGQALYGILSGEARVTSGLAAMGDIDVADILPGQTIGLTNFFQQDTNADPSLSITSNTACKILLIDTQALDHALDNSVVLCRALLGHFARQLKFATSSPQSDVGPARRVFRHLLSLAKKQGAGFAIEQMPRHAALAEIAGVADRVAAETVATLLASHVLRRNYPGAEVVDIERLRQLAR